MQLPQYNNNGVLLELPIEGFVDSINGLEIPKGTRLLTKDNIRQIFYDEGSGRATQEQFDLLQSQMLQALDLLDAQIENSLEFLLKGLFDEESWGNASMVGEDLQMDLFWLQNMIFPKDITVNSTSADYGYGEAKND